MARPGTAHEVITARVRVGNSDRLRKIAQRFNLVSRYEGRDIGSIGKLLDLIAEFPDEKIEAIAVLLDVPPISKEGVDNPG